jgi:hypothetical protein
LKAEVIRSLEFYPASEATLLLEKISGVSDHELADLACRMLKNVQNRMIA